MLSQSPAQPSFNNDHSTEKSDGEDEPSAKKSRSKSPQKREKKVELEGASQDENESGEAEINEEDAKEKDKLEKQGTDDSMESRLISIVLKVCNGEKTVKEAMIMEELKMEKVT
ncbi:hypothetical protein PMAYCL1PPCAC_20399, partial [Pristionchus mayeri]